MISQLCSVTKKLIQSNIQHIFTYLSYTFRLTHRSPHQAVQNHKNKLFISYKFRLLNRQSLVLGTQN
jgi:CRISPR/Cas system CMR subunit Cmr6 (Cas7 group RAMP superfamily)